MTPTKDQLLTLVGLARTVLDALPPTAANMPGDAKKALKLFYDLSEYHGLAPKSAPHIPDDGKI